jgi:nitroreductase
MKEQIVEALKWRYAVQVFDSAKKVSEKDLNTILESGRLAPSSYGFEPWKFIVVENPELRLKLREAAYGQAKVSEAAQLIVLAWRTDGRQNIIRERIERTTKTYGVGAEALNDFQNMMQGSIDRQTDDALAADMKAQTYIALGIMMETASLLGIDNAPMGGFDAAKVDEILGLKEKNLSAAVFLALGYHGQDTAAERPKVRRSFSEVVEFIK